MDKIVNIQPASEDDVAVVARRYQRGASGQPDVLLDTVPLTAATSVAELGVSIDTYILIQDADDENVKSIDNWRPA